VRNEVGSMPGVFNLSIDEAVREAEEAAQLGIGGLLLFGLPETKDEQGTGAWDENGIVQQGCAPQAIAAAKKLVLIADVCLCEYTSHGHCGVVVKPATASKSTTIPRSNCCPHRRQPGQGRRRRRRSQRHDGRPRRRHPPRARRRGLRRRPSSATPRSSPRRFTGPSARPPTPRRSSATASTYQMDGANLREAMREIDLDLEEGADMILMKPAMPYLDVVRAARERVDVPIGAYQVSGEYSMLQAAFEKGWLDRDRAMLESLVGIRRAGADFIVTYFAKDAAKLLFLAQGKHAFNMGDRSKLVTVNTWPQRMAEWMKDSGYLTPAVTSTASPSP
jgi:porphobilinogen synthase